jgi:hypothetical protein
MPLADSFVGRKFAITTGDLDDACYFGGLEVPYAVVNMALVSQAVAITAITSEGVVVGNFTTPILDTGGPLPKDPSQVEDGPNPQMGYLNDLFPALPLDRRGAFCGTFEFHGIGGNIAAFVAQRAEPIRRVAVESVPPGRMTDTMTYTDAVTDSIRPLYYGQKQ